MAIDLSQRQADQLRYLRTVLAWQGVNQAHLAEVIGCTQPNICRRMTGKSRFTVDELLLIADYLRIDPTNLIAPPDLADVLGSVPETARGLVRSTFSEPSWSEAKRYALPVVHCSTCDLDSRAA